MPRFKRKPTYCEAHQFVDFDNPPPGVFVADQDDLRSARVTTMQGQQVRVVLGEWIVKEASGDGYYPIADEEFQRIYEAV